MWRVAIFLMLAGGTLSHAATITFTNAAGITIPVSGTSGPSDPYPSTITVAGMGPLTDITVTFSNFSHTWPGDLDILLVGPTGQNVLLMGAVGGSSDIVGVTLNFTPTATDFLLTEPIVSGTYLPTQNSSGSFAGPAPTGPYGTSLTSFLGTNPNGVWSLYVMDNAGQDRGLMGAWSLTLSDDGTVVPEPGTLGLLSAGLLSLAWFRRRTR
jgi:subtilisin-like proprotein convertase family protein